VRGFGGVRLSHDGLRIDPHLPPQWRSLRFNLVLRGTVVRVAIDPHEVALTAEAGRRLDVPILVGGRTVALRAGETVAVRYAE